MGLFNFPKKKPDLVGGLTAELMPLVYPGGIQEMHHRGNVIVQLTNGKFAQQEAAELFTKAKLRILFAQIKFDGVAHLGITAQRLLDSTIKDSNGKLSLMEAAAIGYYAICDKTDNSLQTPKLIKNLLEAQYGSDEFTQCGNEVPSALGDFGFDPTNPVPARGIASSKLYLSRLRTIHGGSVEFSRVRTIQVPNIPTAVDEYQFAISASPNKLYVCPFCRSTSSKAPHGFVFAGSGPYLGAG